MTVSQDELSVRAADGAQANLIVVQADQPKAGLLWVPALGVTARNYRSFAQALAERGVTVALHEWRGSGSSSLRASRAVDWGYRELLELDLPASLAAARALHPGLRWLVGGHSLGSQMAALLAAQQATSLTGVVIVAGGSPYWRSFPGWKRPFVRLVYAFFGLLSRLLGYFPGRRVGFGGTEARTVMADWLRSGVSGVYRPTGINADLEAALAALQLPLFVAHMAEDQFVPRAGLDFWLAKMPRSAQHVEILQPQDFPSGKANHFSWLKEPQAVVERIVAWLSGRLG